VLGADPASGAGDVAREFLGNALVEEHRHPAGGADIGDIVNDTKPATMEKMM
jgi:hypothetical protein